MPRDPPRPPRQAEQMTTVRTDVAQSTTAARSPKPVAAGDVPAGVTLLPRRTAPAQPTFQQRLASVVREEASTKQVSKAASSSTRFEPLIQKYATKYGVDPALVRAVIQVESNWNPNAVSKAGAKGLMQLMPDTAKAAKVSDPFDPEQNVRAGVEQLAWGLRKYGGNVQLTLAAYNAGPGAVAKYGGVPPYEETQRYLKLVGDLMGASSQPARPAGKTR
jgi:soluble lytic murein transglycosylase-like protein